MRSSRIFGLCTGLILTASDIGFFATPSSIATSPIPLGAPDGRGLYFAYKDRGENKLGFIDLAWFDRHRAERKADTAAK